MKKIFKKIIDSILPYRPKKVLYCKRGKLYRFPYYDDVMDIDKNLLKRFFDRLGIDYIPVSLKKYYRLFLREDRSKYSRKLINYCKKHGIETYVVQEGAIPGYGDNPWGHLPLIADYFVCPEEDKQFWIDCGMEKRRIKTFRLDPEPYTGIVFMHPFYNPYEVYDPEWKRHKNLKVMRVIDRFLDEPVLFKLHPDRPELVSKFIPKHRIITGNAIEIIKTTKLKIYAFPESSILADCKRLGKPCELVYEKDSADISTI